MENKKIIDYVMQSPNNTNPAVLESMLEAIIGGGGSSDGGGLYLHKRFESAAEMRAQPGIPIDNGADGYVMYKFFDETPTFAEVKGGMLYVGENANLNTFMRIDASELTDLGVAWAYSMYNGNVDSDLAQIMCISKEYAEQMGVEAGIYFSEDFFRLGLYEVYIIGNSTSGGGTSGGKIAVFDMSKIDTYEQVPLDEETTLFKLSDEVPTTDELLGGFVCAMTEGDGRGIVIPLIGPFAEQHIQDGVVGVADDMPIMMLVTSEMAAEIPGMSTGIYLYHITNRLIVYAALVWGL